MRLTINDPGSSRAASAVHYSVIFLITVSSVSAVMETVDWISDKYADFFAVLELACTICFTAEILVRIWVSESCLAYAGNFSNIVDVFATLPWYLEEGLDRLLTAEKHTRHSRHMESMMGSFRTLRMVRLVRMVRLLRVLRMAKAVREVETFTTVMESIADSLEGVVVLTFFVGFGAVVSATLVYALESEEEDTKFSSIPSSMWWSMATITTVGYGDVVPATVCGKVIACVTMVFGMIIVSVSVAAITTSFTESYQKRTHRARLTKAVVKVMHSGSAIKGGNSPGSLDAEGTLESATPLSMHTEQRHRDDLDLINTFFSLEEETKRALSRLEAAARQMRQVAVQAEDVRRASSASTVSASDMKAACLRVKDEHSLLLQVLHEQSQLFFKTATGFLEHLANNEAVLSDAGQSPSARPEVKDAVLGNGHERL